jgi:hypothetical protein
MKRIFFAAGVVVALTSCGGANDGDASTDTTTMPIDTAGMNNTGGSNINSNTGSYPTDTSDQRTDVRSSSPSDPNTRRTTPGNTGTDSGRRQ